mgnify:CR=1 FL=1
MIRAIQGKKESRLKRAVKTRKRICETADHRVSVFKSGKHIYAQLSTCLLYTSPSPRDRG